MLDGGPSRVPRPVDRRAMHRAEPPRRYPEEQPASDTGPRSISDPQPADNTQNHTAQSPRRFTKPLIIAALVVLLGVLGWLAWTNLSAGVTATIDARKHQSVLLVNGQTYFGKLEIIDDSFLQLTDVFYVQSNDSSVDQEETTSSNMQLIKRGEEVFGPTDPMVISRDQVVYFENIKDDSQVSKLMKDYKADN